MISARQIGAWVTVMIELENSGQLLLSGYGLGLGFWVMVSDWLATHLSPRALISFASLRGIR